MKILILILAYFPCFLHGWKLPSKEFLENFAQENGAKSVIIYLPITKLSQNIIQTYSKNDFDAKIPSNLIFLPQYKYVERLSFRDQDLHVFVPNDQNHKESIADFIRIFNARTRSRRELWLLDITHIENIKNNLTNLKADIDDDLYLYNYTQIQDGNYEIIKLFEAYKLHDDLPLKIISYGSWDANIKLLNIIKLEKWARRRDLSGVTFKCNTMPSVPYITQMIPKLGNQEEYDIDGFFAEVFFALQVRNNSQG